MHPTPSAGEAPLDSPVRGTTTGANKLKAGLPAEIVIGHKTGSSDRTAEGAVSDTPSSDCAAFCVMPRVGCECWNRLRVTLGYTCTERANRHLSLTFGIAIGGGRR